jgi:hypothetical protein
MQLWLVDVYPEADVVERDPRLARVALRWLNIFGFRPDIGFFSTKCRFSSAAVCSGLCRRRLRLLMTAPHCCVYHSFEAVTFRLTQDTLAFA